jgi:hypothetical protein
LTFFNNFAKRPGLDDLMKLAIQNGMKIKHLFARTGLVGHSDIHRNEMKSKSGLRDVIHFRINIFV